MWGEGTLIEEIHPPESGLWAGLWYVFLIDVRGSS